MDFADREAVLLCGRASYVKPPLEPGELLFVLAENEEVPARIGGARSGEVRTTNSVLYLDPLPVGASEVGENLIDNPLKDFLR